MDNIIVLTSMKYAAFINRVHCVNNHSDVASK